MWKFAELKVIERYGFPDGDYPLFIETKKGKPTGMENTRLAEIHRTNGSDFLHFFGANDYKDYQKLKNRRVEILEYGDTLEITMKALNGEEKTATFYFPYDEDEDGNEEIDWDNQYAVACGKSI